MSIYRQLSLIFNLHPSRYDNINIIYSNIFFLQIPVSTLTFSVAGLAIVDTIIVIAWRYFSPPHKSYEQKEVNLKLKLFVTKVNNFNC